MKKNREEGLKKTKNSFIQSNLKKWIKKLSNDFLIKANFLIRFLNFLEKLVHCTRKLQPIFLDDHQKPNPEIRKFKLKKSVLNFLRFLEWALSAFLAFF